MNEKFRNRQDQLDWLQRLLDKKAMVIRSAQATGRNNQAALDEVDRQLKQVLKDNTITKSGEES